MAIQDVGDMLVCTLTKRSRASSRHLGLPLSTVVLCVGGCRSDVQSLQFYSGCTHSLVAALNQPCTPSEFKKLNDTMQLTFEATVSDDHDVSEARRAWAVGMQRLAASETFEVLH